MIPIEGVDYSYDHPNPDGLKSVDKHFAARYVGPGSTGKHLSPAEASSLTSAGLSIVCVASGAADGMLGGFATGASWARSALTGATGCGMPAGRPIIMSCDFDVQAHQWSRVLDCLRGAQSVLGVERVGIYGGHDAIMWAARDGVKGPLWQTYAWSEGRWHPKAEIHQYRNGVSLVGGTVDLDRALVADYGQWTVGGASTPDSGGSDMGIFESVWNTDQITNPYGDRETNPRMTPETAIVNLCRDTDATLAILRKWQSVDDPHNTDTLAEIATTLTEIKGRIEELTSTPMIDAVAVATAIASHPDIAATLATAVAHRLAAIDLDLTLTGRATGGIRPPTA